MNSKAKSFAEADDIKQFPNGEERILDVAGVPVGFATFRPGWRWSNDIRPLTGTDRCTVFHVGYALSGRLHVEMADGSTLDIEPGDALEIPPGHDAWVVGDEPCVILDWGGKASEYVRPVVKSGIGGEDR
jgi:Cupin domain